MLILHLSGIFLVLANRITSIAPTLFQTPIEISSVHTILPLFIFIKTS